VDTAVLVDELLGGLARGKPLPRGTLTKICGGDQKQAALLHSRLSTHRYKVRQEGGEEAAPKRQGDVMPLLRVDGADGAFQQVAQQFSVAGELHDTGRAVVAVCAKLADLPAVQQSQDCLEDLADVPKKVRRKSAKTGKIKWVNSSQWHAVRSKLARLAKKCVGQLQPPPQLAHPRIQQQQQEQQEQQQQQEDEAPAGWSLPTPSRAFTAHDPADAGRFECAHALWV